MQTAIEIDAVGEAVWVATTEMIDDGRQRDLIALLKGASPTARVPRLVLGRIAHQTLLTKLLQEDPVDFELVDLLLDHMGVAAAKITHQMQARTTVRIAGPQTRWRRMRSSLRVHAAGPGARYPDDWVTPAAHR